LSEFGVPRPDYMTGRNFLELPQAAADKVATR
jgi:hypothetical protein